jgi:hypothetical protein
MTAMRRAAGRLTGALLWIALGGSALACPICFQIEQGPVTDGIRAAVIVLMSVTVVVLTSFGVFVRRLVRASNSSNLTNLTNPTNPTNPS